MTLLLLVFTFIFSCSKDTDLLLDSVITETEVSVETRNYTELPAEEAGFVLRTYTFSPTYDAYLQGEEGHNQDIIRLQEDVRTSFLMFDLSQVDGPITDAVLQFHVDSDEGDGDIRIHQGSSTNWTEYNLNQNNAPAITEEIGSMSKDYLVGDAEKVALKVENLTSKETTLILSHQKGNDLAFASKEHPRNIGPKLIVTYKTEEGSPAIEQEEVYQEEEVQPEEEVDSSQPKTDIPQPDYYVTVNGNSSNDGKTEATAWSISHAFDRAVAGDVVYIKAGNYGNINLIADNSGTPGKKISFIGYTNSPGDLNSSNGSTFNYGDSVNSSKMPLIEGSPLNGIGTGIGITAIESYVHIENFQITKYEYGLFAKGNHSTYKNIIVTNVGNFNPAHSYPSATSDSHLNYSGNGIVISGVQTELLNSFVLNAGAQAITFNNSSDIIASNNKVYSDNNINPTDYYFLIGENTVNSTFTNTTVYRVGELEHLGHGIVFKGNGLINGNMVDGFSITNTVLEAQFPYTRNNTFRNGTITKEAHINVTTPNVSGIRLANGTGKNIFEDIVLTNCSINFHDWKDGLAGDVSDASDDNILRRLTVKDAYSAIAFAYFQVENHASSADNNTFEDCVFTNIEHLFEVDRANSNTLLKNCTINAVNNLMIERIPGGPSYSLNANYENCTWTNIGFTPPN